jgi:hypothetical protein
LAAPAALGTATLFGCRQREDRAAPSARPPPARPVSAHAPDLLPGEERTWSFPTTPVGRMSVVVRVPERLPQVRFPVLVALHGRGETLKGPERGARGWLDDYALGRAIERLGSPPLEPKDLESLVTKERLTTLNRALVETPYQGLVIACPYMPDVLRGDAPFSLAPPLARFIVDTLLPKVYAETPAIGTAAATGIDGVSLGGRGALVVALERPEAFGAVSTLQAAFDAQDAAEILDRTRRARRKNPKLLLRFVTSTEDYYLPALKSVSAALRRAGVEHGLLVAEGPHDYAFNRGPGAYEMLLFHDRVLRGRDPV